jgi:hypothetical protein
MAALARQLRLQHHRGNGGHEKRRFDIRHQPHGGASAQCSVHGRGSIASVVSAPACRRRAAARRAGSVSLPDRVRVPRTRHYYAGPVISATSEAQTKADGNNDPIRHYCHRCPPVQPGPMASQSCTASMKMAAMPKQMIKIFLVLSDILRPFPLIGHWWGVLSCCRC